MLASVAALVMVVSGSRFDRANLQNHLTKDPKACVKPAKFIQERYGPLQLYGVGATGCGWGGVDKESKQGDARVVIKITKGTGKMNKMAEFCAVMDHMHTEACKLGGDDLKLARMHLPACYDFGVQDEDEHGYTVMSNGGTIAIGRADNKYTPGAMETNREVFVQLIAAVGVMHRTGVAHNNLHGKNAMLNEDLQLTIIDFGNAHINDPDHEKVNPGKADLHELQNHLAAVIGCKGGDKATTAGAKILHSCVEKDLEADKDFMDAFDAFLDASVNNRHDVGLESVVGSMWKTEFVQKYHPGAQARFVDPKAC